MTNEDEQLKGPEPSDEAAPDVAVDDSNAPQPPARWSVPESQEPVQSGNPTSNMPQMPNGQELPHIGSIGGVVFRLEGQDAVEFERARKYVTGANILALVSLVFGGVILSTVAIVLAAIGRNALCGLASKQDNVALGNAFRRSGTIAVVMGVIAFVLNAISLILLYPIFVEIMQNGDVSSLMPFGSGQSAGTAGSGSLF